MPYFIYKHMVQMKTYIISIRKLTAPAIFVLLLFFYLTPGYAMKVTLTWNPSPGAAGYKLYYKTGSPGPPYNGTGATKNISPTIINSPIDIGASTRATIHLPDGAYHFALTAYNKYGESEYTTGYSTCKIQKVNAAKTLCTRLLSDYSKIITAPDRYHLDSLVEIAEEEFYSFWEKTKDMALITGDVCPTASMEYIGDRIVLAVEDMVQQISDGVVLESSGGRKLAVNLLREIQAQSARSFENEESETFQIRWNQIIAWARVWRVTYDGPPSSDIEDIVDAMVTEVLADIL